MPTALILGAASDMAIAIAEKFASARYDIQLAARNVSRLEPLQSDLAIKYSSRVSIHDFDALAYDTHENFFSDLEPKPDVTICVFGLLGENEKATEDWSQASKNHTYQLHGCGINFKYCCEILRRTQRWCNSGY